MFSGRSFRNWAPVNHFADVAWLLDGIVGDLGSSFMYVKLVALVSFIIFDCLLIYLPMMECSFVLERVFFLDCRGVFDIG